LRDTILKRFFLTSRRPTRWKFLRALIGSLIGWAVIVGMFCYSGGQDHFAAIPLNGNGNWYGNYVIKDMQILDSDIYFHGIGRSIEHARAADLLFLGTSRVVFGLNWRVFDAFAQKHQVGMFNMGFAGVMSANFSRMLIHRWDLKPRLWVIDIYADPTNSFASSFFNPAAGLGAFESPSIARDKIEAYANVGITDLRWRVKMALGIDEPASYRSDETGNWYVDRWPNYLRTDLPKMGKGRPIARRTQGRFRQPAI
jgi:hypothetical protein